MKYRKLTLILALFFGVLTFAQESTAIGFRYTLPQISPNDAVSKKHYQQLEQRIKRGYGKTNIFATQTPFSIVPHIEVLDAKNAGEVHMVKVVKVAVLLSIEDLDNQIQFNSFETTLLATDDNLSKAISKAIRQMKASDPKFRMFFTEAEKNILTFYKNNCAKIVKAAKTNIERKEFNKAYANLMYVPESIACYNEVERLMTSIYQRTKDENCREMMHKAHLEKVQENYDVALNYLSLIDPKASCYTDVSKLIDEVGVSIGKESMNDFNMKKLRFEKMTDLEKIRILAPNADFLQINFDG